ncbi:MAG: hypothetical protein ACT4PU_01850 [Planctomycetota bacterium]
MRRLRPLALLFGLLVTTAVGCQQSEELRARIISLDRDWRLAEMPQDSFGEMLEAIAELGEHSASNERHLASIPDLLRLVLLNPSAHVRAQALRTAWRLGADLPGEPWRTEPLERKSFNERTARLEALLFAEPAAAENETELLELAHWLGAFRVEPAGDEELRVALSIAEVSTSRALWDSGPVADAFRRHVAGSLHHALTVLTLHAAYDAYPEVREAALAGARHIEPQLALQLVGGVLEREEDSAVLLAALETAAQLAAAWPGAEVTRLLAPLASSNDVAVRQRVAQILSLAAT